MCRFLISKRQASSRTAALRQDLSNDADLEICDGIEDYRAIAFDIGAAYWDQLAFAHFRSQAGKAEVQIRAIRKVSI